MRCLTFDESSGLRLEERAAERHPSECLIRVDMSGICGTDLQILRGYAGFSGIPGHEFVGTVVETPSADSRWMGRRVVGEINIGCGACEWCAQGVKEHCLDRRVLGIRGRAGAFADFVSLPAVNLHDVPSDLPDEAAVFAEPVAAACRILDQIDIDERTAVAVLGDGRLGLLTAQVLRTTGAPIVVRGRRQRKLEIARSLGLEAAEDDRKTARRFDVVVDATGRAEGLRRSLELVKPRGTIVLKTTCEGETQWPAWAAVVDEVRLVGSRCGPFAPALRLLASGALQTQPLISAVFALTEYEKAFDAARTELKVLFRHQEPSTKN